MGGRREGWSNGWACGNNMKRGPRTWQRTQFPFRRLTVSHHPLLYSSLPHPKHTHTLTHTQYTLLSLPPSGLCLLLAPREVGGQCNSQLVVGRRVWSICVSALTCLDWRLKGTARKQDCLKNLAYRSNACRQLKASLRSARAPPSSDPWHQASALKFSDSYFSLPCPQIQPYSVHFYLRNPISYTE